MSFILDALKKSENDRQRQTGPALFEVRVAAPRSKFPLLAVSIISLLVVNVGVVAWLVMRKPATAAVPAETAPAATNDAASANLQTQPQGGFAPTQGSQANSAYGQQGGPPSQQNYAGGYNGAGGQQPGGFNGGANGGGFNAGQGGPNGAGPAGYPPNGYASNGSYPPPNNANYQQGPNNGGYTQGANQGGYPQAPNGAYQRGAYPNAASNGGPVLEESGRESYNPDDYAPAREPPPPGANAGSVSRGTESGLPTYEEVAGRMQLPPLHLDLHSYAPEPAKRFVLLNMKRLYEGQTTAEGVKVEAITNDAAILSYKGSRFVLDGD